MRIAEIQQDICDIYPCTGSDKGTPLNERPAFGTARIDTSQRTTKDRMLEVHQVILHFAYTIHDRDARPLFHEYAKYSSQNHS